MTAPLFLIAHSVRGEAAFDVALQMDCPHCMPEEPSADFFPIPEEGCAECDGNGFWWIIPTSGHRAFPYWFLPLNALYKRFGDIYDSLGEPPEMPSGWPDHYRHGPVPKVNIMSLFKAQRPAQPHIPRRL